MKDEIQAIAIAKLRTVHIMPAEKWWQPSAHGKERSMTDQLDEQDLLEAREWLRTISFHHYNWHEKDVQTLAAKLAHVRREAVAGVVEACAKACLNNVLSEKQMNEEPNLHIGEMCLRLCHERDAASIRKLTLADAVAEIERIKTFVEAATIMRFRKLLDRLGIHGYYNEMQKEFGGND